MRASMVGLLLVVASATFAADERPDVGANSIVQSAADEIRAAAGTDLAFIGAGLLKDSISKDDLGSMLQYPTDEIVVLNLTGEQIRQALERSVSLFPERNQSFLQLSGVEVVFRRSASPSSRLASVTVAGNPLVDGKTYSVAMPSMLAKGGLGYFKVWEQNKVVRRLDRTMESVLKGRKGTDTAPRWTAAS